MSELASAVLRATVDRYPEIDYLLIGMPELRQWVGDYERAWNALDRKYHPRRKVKLTDVLAAASRRSNYPGGAERAVQEVKGDIVLLYFYDKLLTELKAVRETRRPDVTIVIDSVAEELVPILPRILPPGSETLHFVDYTPTRVLSRRKVLGSHPGAGTATSLIYTLHDDNVGLLPATRHRLAPRDHTGTPSPRLERFLHTLLADRRPRPVRRLPVAGRLGIGRVPGEVYRDQIRAVFGADCVDDDANGLQARSRRRRSCWSETGSVSRSPCPG